jgi:hypothetical protein
MIYIYIFKWKYKYLTYNQKFNTFSFGKIGMSKGPSGVSVLIRSMELSK